MDPVGLWWHLARALPVASRVPLDAGWQAGVILLAPTAVATPENAEVTVARLLTGRGWAVGHGEPIEQRTAGLSDPALHRLLAEGRLERISHGLDLQVDKGLKAPKGRCIMPAVSAPERKEAVERTDQRSRGLGIAVAILAVIAVVLGGWLVFELQRTDETALTPEVQAVMDDYSSAWNAYDVDAFSAVVTPDYRFHQNLGQTGLTAEETAAWMTDVFADRELSIEAIGPYQMVGDESSAQVTSTDRYLSRFGSTLNTGVSVFWLVKDGDAWKIQTHFVVA